MFIKHIEEETHNTLSFEAKVFLPLSYDDFCIARKEGFNSLNISCLTDKISIEKNGGIESTGRGKIDMPIKFRQPLPVYALVAGGWLPPAFVQPPNLLADSNAIGNLEAINKGNAQTIYEQMDWWFTIPNESDLTINPLFYALEGNQLRTPTLQELKSGFSAATEVIKGKFPKAKIIEYEDIQFNAAFEVITNIAKDNEKDIEFLTKVAPLIVDPVPAAKLLETENNIIKIALETKLSLKSLSVLTVLSCLYDDGKSGFTAARKVLNPSTEYTQKNIYNALADLNALRLFIGFLALSKSIESESFAFCTSDKAILLLWSGFKFRDIKFVEGEGASAV